MSLFGDIFGEWPRWEQLRNRPPSDDKRGLWENRPPSDDKRGVYLTKLIGGLLTLLVKKEVLTSQEAREIVSKAREASEAA